MRGAILLLANIGIVLPEIVLAPSSTVVVAGELMTMTCVMNNNSRVRNWEIFTTNMKAFTIYKHSKFHSLFKHFGVDVDDGGSGTLYTNSTNLSDAGIYKCLSVIDDQDKEYSAHLTVLESMPICEENFTLNSLNSSKFLLNGGCIWMQCNVIFRGFWTPTIEWIEYGGNLGPKGRILTEGVKLTRIPNKIVTSNLTIAVTSSRHGSRFACKIYFAKYDGRYNMTATNVPNFTYTWTSSVLILSFSSPESVSTTLDAVESSTVTRFTREDLERPYSADWYFISLSLVAALSVFFIIIIALAVAFCICFKKKHSAEYASAVSEKLEMPIRDGDCDILPYSTSDNYETIDNAVFDADLRVSFTPRQSPLPTPGYSGLTQTDALATGLYSRIDTYETPVDIVPESTETKVITALDNYLGEAVDDREGKKSGREMDLQQERNLPPVHPYIELFDGVDGDNLEQYKRTSDCDIQETNN